jgi:predicted RNA binding protein YcfA (HicA-like mRNA interferase family)
MKLPVVSGLEFVKALRSLGYELDEQHGSHMILRRTDRSTGGCPYRITEKLLRHAARPDSRGGPHG